MTVSYGFLYHLQLKASGQVAAVGVCSKADEKSILLIFGLQDQRDTFYVQFERSEESVVWCLRVQRLGTSTK